MHLSGIKRTKKMMPQTDGQAEPLCKFGPGGDFITAWQPELTKPSGPQEKAKDVVANSKTNSTVNSAPDATIEDGRVLSREPMLFPDNSRVSSRIKHKPKYRIRTYRRAAKKRFAFGPSEQGSLFELDFQRARTA
jgi:hypothetical protein